MTGDTLWHGILHGAAKAPRRPLEDAAFFSVDLNPQIVLVVGRPALT